MRNGGKRLKVKGERLNLADSSVLTLDSWFLTLNFRAR